jgi:DNA-binding NarL/FixJ family response regulator
MAYSNMAQLRMLGSDLAGARIWGAKAIALAERLDETEILVHALNNVGTAELVKGAASGRAKLERSLALALEAGLDEHVARAYTNLGTIAVDQRAHTLAATYLDAGIAYSAERDLDAWETYMIGYRARSELDRGAYDAAAATAAWVVDDPGATAPIRITPLAVLGRLRARRAEPDPWPPLDEALDLARRTGELQRLAAVAIARAEARWLAGETDRVDEETAEALALALAQQHDPWVLGEICVWRHRAGLTDDVAPDAMAEAFRLELDGDYAGAATAWDAIGGPYEAALARAHAEDESEQRRALAELQRLGAGAAAARVARSLRERGLTGLRHGPRASTKRNPAGMTKRELEVLAHVAEGLRNAEIAARLFLSEKTVAHHVSAILRKLKVATRSQAGAEAARLGIVER